MAIDGLWRLTNPGNVLVNATDCSYVGEKTNLAKLYQKLPVALQTPHFHLRRTSITPRLATELIWTWVVLETS